MSSAPNTRFAEFVKNHGHMAEELPLVHSTRCERVREIAKKDKLVPQHCNFFGECLIYLFYGRPAYQHKTLGAVPSTSVDYCPVCFVFRPYTISAGFKRLYPFDTGASKNGMFEPHVLRDKVDDFEMPSVIESARMATNLFFDTNHKYYTGHARLGLVIPATEAEASNYYQLISHEGEDPYDERRSAMEIQANSDITLRNNLLAVILPTSFLGETGIREAIVKRWLAFPLNYSFTKGTIPREYRRDISRMLEKFLQDGGFL